MVETSIFRGGELEDVSYSAEKLIVSEGVFKFPEHACHNYQNLQQVTMLDGLKYIGEMAFIYCCNLEEISMYSTIVYIGERAFDECSNMTKVEFLESPKPNRNQMVIEEKAFRNCESLARIKLPSSAVRIGKFAFEKCLRMVEVNLSTTVLTKITVGAFSECRSLQTVSLPKTLEHIRTMAFYDCRQLVTMVVPRDSNQPIRIDGDTFSNCGRLANIWLPKDSDVQDRTVRRIMDIQRRFDDRPVHRACYDHAKTTVPEFRQCIAEHLQEGQSTSSVLLLDAFQMTPLHVFFSTCEPRVELLEVLLELLPNQIVLWKDVNKNWPLDYLIRNWSDAAKVLLERTVQKCIMDPLARWGTTSWMETIQRKLEEILAEDTGWNRRQRNALFLYFTFEHFANVQATSILEMALWKEKLKSGRTSDGSKRQALDRQECRCLSGSDMVIPHIVAWLGISKMKDPSR